MTNPIPPCPVCGVVPIARERMERVLFPQCKCLWKGTTIQVALWGDIIRDILCAAISDNHGIHTLAELGSRLAGADCPNCNNSGSYAAQRGEG